MRNANTDKKLTRAGVKFLPWIGDKYFIQNRRLLILGESHYDTFEVEGQLVQHQYGQQGFDQAFTRCCIEEVIRQDEGVASFWKTLEQGLLNEERLNGWAPSGGASLWNKVAFYNFVQTPVCGGARTRPTSEQFENSYDAFKAVLEALCPDRVLVCGYGLWENMPPADQDQAGEISSVMQYYTLQGGAKVWCYATVHPSCGRYSWRNLHPLIIRFLESDHPEEMRAITDNHESR